MDPHSQWRITAASYSHAEQMLCNTAHYGDDNARVPDGELPPSTSKELKPQRESTTVPEGILVEIDSGENWLIDWDTEILPHTLPHPEPCALSSSSLVLASTET